MRDLSGDLSSETVAKIIEILPRELIMTGVEIWLGLTVALPLVKWGVKQFGTKGMKKAFKTVETPLNVIEKVSGTLASGAVRTVIPSGTVVGHVVETVKQVKKDLKTNKS